MTSSEINKYTEGIVAAYRLLFPGKSTSMAEYILARKQAVDELIKGFKCEDSIDRAVNVNESLRHITEENKVKERPVVHQSPVNEELKTSPDEPKSDFEILRGVKDTWN